PLTKIETATIRMAHQRGLAQMTDNLRIVQKSTGEYEVTVMGPPLTTHRVNLSSDYYDQLTGGAITPEELLRRSFDFLLERESNTMILSSFDLPIIGKYFNEYEAVIKAGI
ncbi:MAG: hypothetical protein AAF492_07705, partial [Verrucomicrobiota bacterium]